MKMIELTKGQVALVDDEDFDFLNQWKWIASKDCNTYYAQRCGSRKLNNGKQKTIKMHRLILGLTDGKIKIDHIDRNGLNNQRSNLRKANDAQSAQNRGAYNGAFSKYKGVMYDNGKFGIKRWIAKFTKNNKCVYVGRFHTEIEAAIAYNKKVLEMNGQFAFINEIKQETA